MSDSTRQAHELRRVKGRVADRVLEYLKPMRPGQTFSMSELSAWVAGRVHCAPDSPRRVFHALSKDGLIAYRVVSRSRSLYELICGPGGDPPPLGLRTAPGGGAATEGSPASDPATSMPPGDSRPLAEVRSEAPSAPDGPGRGAPIVPSAQLGLWGAVDDTGEQW